MPTGSRDSGVCGNGIYLGQAGDGSMTWVRTGGISTDNNDGSENDDSSKRVVEPS